MVIEPGAAEINSKAEGKKMLVAFRSWKRQGGGFTLKSPEGT